MNRSILRPALLSLLVAAALAACGGQPPQQGGGPGQVTVVTLKAAPTAAGVNAPIMVKKDAKGKPVVMIDGAKVVKTDIDAKNGVIHVIDSVILPD